MKQLDTQRRFEITDALADRRFRNVQARRGGGYASSLHHAHKCQDVVEAPVPRSLLVDRLCDWHVFTLCGVGVDHEGDRLFGFIRQKTPYAQCCICKSISSGGGIMFSLRLVMIHSEPATTTTTMKMPNASASTLFVLSGPVVMWRKNTR